MIEGWFKYRNELITVMRGLVGTMDGHEMTRALRAAERAVDHHTRRTHFHAPETKIVTEGVEESVEQGVKKGIRGWYKQIMKGRVIDGTKNVTRQAVVSTTILAGGIWFMTSAANISLGWLGDSSEKVNEFAEESPLIAGGIGIGMLLGVAALGIVIFRRISGDGDEE